MRVHNVLIRIRPHPTPVHNTHRLGLLERESFNANNADAGVWLERMLELAQPPTAASRWRNATTKVCGVQKFKAALASAQRKQAAERTGMGTHDVTNEGSHIDTFEFNALAMPQGPAIRTASGVSSASSGLWTPPMSEDGGSEDEDGDEFIATDEFGNREVDGGVGDGLYADAGSFTFGSPAARVGGGAASTGVRGTRAFRTRNRRERGRNSGSGSWFAGMRKQITRSFWGGGRALNSATRGSEQHVQHGGHAHNGTDGTNHMDGVSEGGGAFCLESPLKRNARTNSQEQANGFGTGQAMAVGITPNPQQSMAADVRWLDEELRQLEDEEEEADEAENAVAQMAIDHHQDWGPATTAPR
jgi:hypothetical protein